MKTLKSFKSFSSINEGKIYESTSETRKNVRDLIRIYVDKTNNKGGDEKLCAQTAESIVKALDNSPSKAFLFFSDYGIGSIPLLDILTYLFGKYGFFKGEFKYNTALEIKRSSEEFFDEHEEVIKALADIIVPSKLKNNKNLPLWDDLNERKENLENKSMILDRIDGLACYARAINEDNPSLIDVKYKSDFLDLAFRFISDYKNASKLESQCPKIFQFLKSESGEEDIDLASGLGNIGF